MVVAKITVMLLAFLNGENFVIPTETLTRRQLKMLKKF
jgi:hypothetical protein